MLIRKLGPVNSHNFFHEKGGTAVDSSSTASSKIRIFSRASKATLSSSSHVDDDIDRDRGCSKSLASSSSVPSCSFDDSSSCSRNWVGFCEVWRWDDEMPERYNINYNININNNIILIYTK
ncbi:hypothetical protein ACFX1T_010016 [Malus domestica]